MSRRLATLLLAGFASLGALSSAHASLYTGSYAVTVVENLTYGSSFTTGPSALSPGAQASFTYRGSLDFDNEAAQNPPPGGDLNSTFGFSASNMSAYSGHGTVSYASHQVANFGNVSNFLNSSGSASNYSYGSLFSFDLGKLAAGTVLTITHDDGVALYQNGVSLGQTVAGATAQTTDTVVVGASSYDTILWYSRQNGTPSILEVAVPEPLSLSLLGAGLVALGLVRRRRS